MEDNGRRTVKMGDNVGQNEKCIFFFCFCIFSCDSSSIADNVRRSVGLSVRLSVGVNDFFSSK